MRNHHSFAIFSLLFFGAAAGGCDSLHARLIAQRAVDQYHKGEITQAAASFAEAAKLDGNIPAIQLDLGFANLALYQANPRSVAGQKAATDAINAFQAYLRLKPEERAKSYLIQTFVDTGRYDDAVAFFKPVVEKNPPDGEALGTLGTIASKTGRFDDAKKWYQVRIDAQPENADARLAMGVLIWDYLHGHTDVVGPQRIALADEAIKTMAEAIRLQPNAPNAYTYTNLVYRERSFAQDTDDGKRADIEEANKFFKMAVERQKAAAPKDKK